MKISKGSSYEKIIKSMQANPFKEWMVYHFNQGNRFVWYEAGTRIGDLVRAGYIESHKIEGSRFCWYSLTDKGLEFLPEKYTVAEDVSHIFEKETTAQYIFRKIRNFF